ncbi:MULTISPECIES: helix-turn-helix transcriptional regulator [unclassified Bradyrhizobium]|uniref:helix-turn-helix transcriptional regulator n=1 Tax=unclassified Bradyrhizobium TaxID=2631580 RepID=UPI0028ED3B4C|nr:MULTISPECIES: helix-turn-helix transcriptional regulator [unclassified Bradyrhizobium]
MPHVRTKAPNGDGIVIVPEADYDRMIEELEDLRDSLMARRTLREIESGQKPGTAATLKKIAKALRITVDDLI